MRVSRLSRTATSSVAVALSPLHDNLSLAPVCTLLTTSSTTYSPSLGWPRSPFFGKLSNGPSQNCPNAPHLGPAAPLETQIPPCPPPTPCAPQSSFWDAALVAVVDMVSLLCQEANREQAQNSQNFCAGCQQSPQRAGSCLADSACHRG